MFILRETNIMKKVALAMLIGGLSVSVASAEDFILDETSAAGETTCFDAIYGGAGVGGSFLKVKDSKYNRFLGSLLVGGGKAFQGKYYGGAEYMMDFMADKTKADLKNKGFNQQFGARFGYVFNGDSMAYGRFGYQHSEVKNMTNSISKKQWAPTLALGGERIVWRNASARVEAEYAFGKKHEGVRYNKGWNVRMLGAYNFKY